MAAKGSWGGRALRPPSGDLPEYTVAQGEVTPPVLKLLQGVEENERGCWVWTGKLTTDGYARVYVDKWGRQSRYAYGHRLSWMFFKGPIPKGYVVDHLCRNHACVSPAHLEPVTEEVNVRRGTFLNHRRKRKQVETT